MGELNSASQIADTQDQIAALQTKLNSLQATYASFLANAQQGASNIISVMIPAELPAYPIGPNRILISLVAAVAGLVFAAGTAYLIEFSANTINTSDEAAKLLQTSVLGVIPEIKAENMVKYILEFPFSPAAESFRSLRTNIEYTGVDRPIKVIMISSPGMAEGKSTIATNLAMMLARSEKKVILVVLIFEDPLAMGCWKTIIPVAFQTSSLGISILKKLYNLLRMGTCWFCLPVLRPQIQPNCWVRTR